MTTRPEQFCLLSPHGRALHEIIRHRGQVRLRDLALTLDVTERTAFTLVDELASAGLIERHRVGRRNHYAIPGDVEYMIRNAPPEMWPVKQ